MYFKDEPITVEEIQEFFEELPTYMKSESVPAYQSENVYKIVSTTFNQVVHDPDKNVFVYIFNNKVSNKEVRILNIYKLRILDFYLFVYS